MMTKTRLFLLAPESRSCRLLFTLAQLTLFLLVPRLLISQALGSPQALAFAGLRSTADHRGRFNAVKTDRSGNLFLLLDQGDGVRVLKTDPTVTTLLAQSLVGAAGDSGLALDLDLAGNVYVTGTSTSGALVGTSGAAFPNRADTSTNSFIAKYDNSLTTLFITFAGSGRLAASAVAATADSVFLTGSLFSATLPVTPGSFQQVPATGGSTFGFVERFSADGSILVYATYLTGANGDTSPATLAADASDSAYVGGYTTTASFPTLSALVPSIQSADTPASGFLTKLTPAGDALAFSTFIPGAGVSSVAIDPTTSSILLAGSLDLGAFPVARVQSPLVSTQYQALARMSSDGSGVLSSTLLAPAAQSTIALSSSGSLWIEAGPTDPLSTRPTLLLPVAPLSNIGTSFALHITAQGAVDETARFGGLASTNQANASAPVSLTSVTTDLVGQPLLAGVFTPTASAALLGTQRYDLPLANAPPAILPSTVTDAALTPGACDGSLCSGSAAYLAKLTTAGAAPALTLSLGASPDIILRNLGTAQATGLQLTSTGFVLASNCGPTLEPGGECTIALTGTGPGTLTAQATNAPTQSAALPLSSASPTSIVFSPRELDFGVQTASSQPTLRTVTVTNLGQQTQTFTSSIEALNTTRGTSPPFSEASSDCPVGALAITKILPAGASCHITLALTITPSLPDGPLLNLWKIASSGSHDVLLTGFANSAALSLSSSRIDFGTQFAGGLRSPRFLYLSNNSDASIQHLQAASSGGSPFTITDRCPAVLAAHSVCQIQFGYESPSSPTSDTVSLSLDQGLSVLVVGRTLAQPLSPIGTTNTNLVVSPSVVVFPNSVPITSQSTGTQTVSIANTGSSSFPLAVAVTGDFTVATNCASSLPAHQTCSVVLTFAPSASGTRSGLLTITSSAGSMPVYVGLSGTASSILTDENGIVVQASAAIDFGPLYLGQPSVKWFKVVPPLQTFTASATGAFGVILVEDLGFGHGLRPPSAFQTTASGSCTNCYLGVQFNPTSTGALAGTLTLNSATGSNSYILPLTGSGLPLSGILMSPAVQDFGLVPVHSSSKPLLFNIANLLSAGTTVSVSAPVVSGDFFLSQVASGGAACSGDLASLENCFVQIVFSPTALGVRTGTLTVPTSSGSVVAALSGTASSDPGISLTPSSIDFEPVPDATSTRQTISLANTGNSTIQVGTVTSTSSAFSAISTCGTLGPAATCTLTVTYTPSPAQGSGTLQIPVSNGGTLDNYVVPLQGGYTSLNAGLQMLPLQTAFAPSPVNTLGPTRSFILGNRTSQQQSISLVLPRQFALDAPNPCPALEPGATCTFNVISLPVTTGNIAGTITAIATAPGSVTTTSALGYLQSFASSSFASILRITGNLSPGTGFLDFGQVASGQTYTQNLRLSNVSATGATLHVRRVTSLPPFLSTTTCAGSLLPGQSCTVAIAYTPLNQVPQGSNSTPAAQNTGTLLIESDDSAQSAVVNLAGSASPVVVAAPVNNSPVASYSLSQNSLTFPTTAVGNISAAQTITFTNTGTTTLHVGSLASIVDFTTTNNCLQPIVPGAACTLSVSFTPGALGLRTSVLEIASDSGNALDFVTLAGSSSPSSLLLVPASLDFGSIVLGASATQTVQLTNNGQVSATLGSITTTGDYAATDNCPHTPANLPSGAVCAVQLTFTPTITGVRPGRLSVANSTSTLPLSVWLNGTGVQSRLQPTPATLAFGNVGVGSSLDLTVTLINSGTAPLSSVALAIVGDYFIARPCSTGSLAPAQSCQVTITFKPAAVGARPGTLTVTSTDSTSPLTISLTGTGIQSRLQVSPTTLDFGNLTVGSSASQALTLTNTGTAVITAITTSIAGDYSIVAACGTTTLAPNQSCTITIAFSPTAAGLRNGTLTLNDSDPASPTSVSFLGTGIPAVSPSHLQIAPAAISFGSVPLGSAATLNVSLSNPGTSAITAILLTATGDYTVLSSCGSMLAPGQNCSAAITFAPTASGTRPGTLVVSSSDPLSPATVALTGGGTPVASSGSFTLIVNGAATSTMSVASGSTATYNLLLTPVAGFTGPIVMNCTPLDAVPYSSCALLPSTVTLAGSSQPATLTITTLTSLASPSPVSALLASGTSRVAVSLILPGCFFLLWRRRPIRTRLLMFTVALSSAVLIGLAGCGGGLNLTLRYVTPGTYHYQVTASSTSTAPITQSVTVALVVAQR